MAKKPAKKFIQKAIKRPGALTKAAGKTKAGGVNEKKVKKLQKSGTTLQKQEANFYENVLKPANKKRKATKAKSKPKKKAA